MKKTWVLIAIVVVLHFAAISALFLLQGCGTPGGRTGEPRPVVMPPMTLPEPVPVSTGAAPGEPAAIPDATVYTVKSGDSLSRIAQRYGTSQGEILALNNLANPHKIRIGQKLLLPGYVNTEKPVSRSAASAPAPDAGNVYVVKKGDSLSMIASELKVSEDELAQINALPNRNKIFVGQKLVIPVSATGRISGEPEAKPSEREEPAVEVQQVIIAPSETVVVKPAGDTGIYHVVDAGQDLASIAGLYLVSVEELAEVNNLSADSRLEAGQQLRIP